MRNSHLQEIADLISEENCDVILAGDLNAAPWTAVFDKLRAVGLKDSSEGKGLQFTWPSMWLSFMRIPLDHILISKNVVVLERRTLGYNGSDHFPVFVRLVIR